RGPSASSSLPTARRPSPARSPRPAPARSPRGPRPSPSPSPENVRYPGPANRAACDANGPGNAGAFDAGGSRYPTRTGSAIVDALAQDVERPAEAQAGREQELPGLVPARPLAVAVEHAAFLADGDQHVVAAARGEEGGVA